MPASRPVTVEPLTAQMVGVVLVRVTTRPEVAVALAAVMPATLRVAGLKLIAPMVCVPWVTVMFCVT